VKELDSLRWELIHGQKEATNPFKPSQTLP
jgi:hypothetical protein